MRNASWTRPSRKSNTPADENGMYHRHVILPSTLCSSRTLSNGPCLSKWSWDATTLPAPAPPTGFPASATQTITIDHRSERPAFALGGGLALHFKLALVVLTDHELTDAEWDDYGRAMDFMARRGALPGRGLPERAIPRAAHRLGGVDVDTGAHLPYLNFYQATGGRATIEFVELVPK